MIATPVTTTAVVNTTWRGSRRWSHNNVTTPIAAPIPSAVINSPKADGPPCSTSVATVGPSGTIAPPPTRPPARPIITPRTSGFARMKPSPSLMSRQVCAAGTRGARTPFALRQAEARDQEGRQQERAAVDPDRERLRLLAEPGERREPAQPVRDRGQGGEQHRAQRERAERGDETERVRGRELLGVLHDVGNASRPSPAPRGA